MLHQNVLKITRGLLSRYHIGLCVGKLVCNIALTVTYTGKLAKNICGIVSRVYSLYYISDCYCYSN